MLYFKSPLLKSIPAHPSHNPYTYLHNPFAHPLKSGEAWTGLPRFPAGLICVNTHGSEMLLCTLIKIRGAKMATAGIVSKKLYGFPTSRMHHYGYSPCRPLSSNDDILYAVFLFIYLFTSWE